MHMLWQDMGVQAARGESGVTWTGHFVSRPVLANCAPMILPYLDMTPRFLCSEEPFHPVLQHVDLGRSSVIPPLTWPFTWTMKCPCNRLPHFSSKSRAPLRQR